MTTGLTGEAEAVHGGRGLGAVGGAEFGEDVGHVHAGGFFADEQRVGDLPVRAALRYQR